MFIILRNDRIPLLDKDKTIKLFSTREQAEISISSYPWLIITEGMSYAKSRAECLK